MGLDLTKKIQTSEDLDNRRKSKINSRLKSIFSDLDPLRPVFENQASWTEPADASCNHNKQQILDSFLSYMDG